LALTPILIWLGLNFQQLYSAISIWNETNRLINQAKTADEFQNPAPLEDHFDKKLSADFWDFVTINGGGQVSNELEWHASALTVGQGLTLRQKTDDPEFVNESSTQQAPSAERYNNVTLIGGSGFQPTPSSDVVLQFSANADEGFYGTAGVIFEPQGTLGRDGMFQKPFDMFGFAVVGEESAMQGINGALCYLALNWAPAKVAALGVNPQARHDYEIRLRWVSQTGWLGIVKVDDKVACQMKMPALGPTEIQVWSDNYLIISTPRRWWELGPTMSIDFQDGGDKQFHLGYIRIFEKVR
jgi:hypothetical protein